MRGQCRSRGHVGPRRTLGPTLLCRECHVAKGIEDRPEPAHSYYRYWYHGCRCATCKAANARKSARQRERKLGERWG